MYVETWRWMMTYIKWVATKSNGLVMKCYLFVLGDSDSEYDLDTTDDGRKGDIDNILGINVMPTTYTVTQVQTVYATVPPSLINGLPSGPHDTAIHVIPSKRFI